MTMSWCTSLSEAFPVSVFRRCDAEMRKCTLKNNAYRTASMISQLLVFECRTPACVSSLDPVLPVCLCLYIHSGLSMPVHSQRSRRRIRSPDCKYRKMGCHRLSETGKHSRDYLHRGTCLIQRERARGTGMNRKTHR